MTAKVRQGEQESERRLLLSSVRSVHENKAGIEKRESPFVRCSDFDLFQCVGIQSRIREGEDF
jgi:hypothetical protein